MKNSKKIGVLLINLGTPDSPDVPAVRRYLREFLLDPLVIDLPMPLRWVLVNALILPTRPKQSAQAYQQIWREDGSPLLIYSQAICDRLNDALGEDCCVALGMRYGKPSIAKAVADLKAAGCEQLTVLPLFPQYSAAATGSAINQARNVLKQLWPDVPYQVIPDFYDDAQFIAAEANLIRTHLEGQWPEKIIFSYHGLPVRHLVKGGCEQSCAQSMKCLTKMNREQCYRRQCFATTHAIALALQLQPAQYTTTFQSRLGRTEWIKPYTDQVLSELAGKGIKKIAIVCPSFVADCLETLEEIGIRAREQWQSLGGESLQLLPCLNDHPMWIAALAAKLKVKWESLL